MQKVALFAFRDDPMCFIHVLLTALDMHARGFTVGIVFEGKATTLVAKLQDPASPLHQLYAKAKDANLVLGACRACSAKLGALDAVKAEGLALLDDMNGHPSMAAYIEKGFTVLTF